MTIQIYSILRLSVSNYDLGLREDDHFHYCYMPVNERLEVYLPLNMWLVGVEHNLAPLQTLLQQPRLW